MTSDYKSDYIIDAMYDYMHESLDEAIEHFNNENLSAEKWVILGVTINTHDIQLVIDSKTKMYKALKTL